MSGKRNPVLLEIRCKDTTFSAYFQIFTLKNVKKVAKISFYLHKCKIFCTFALANTKMIIHMKKVFFCLALSLIAILTSCSGSKSSYQVTKIDYMPVKISYNQYGLMDNTGHVICNGQFTESPSAVIGGMFSARKTYKGYQVCVVDGDSYKVVRDNLKKAGVPMDGLVPVLDNDGKIKIINKSGEEAFPLHKDVVLIEPTFQYGHIAYCQDCDGKYLCGAVNTKGEVVIEPIYRAVRIYGEDLFYVRDAADANYFINAKGEKLTNWRDDLYYDHGSFNEAGFAPSPYVLGYNEDHKNILFDKNGNVVFEFPDYVKGLYAVTDKMAIYTDYPGDSRFGYGVMTLTGKQIVPVHYDGNWIMITDKAIYAYNYNEEGARKYNFNGEFSLAPQAFYAGICNIEGFGIVGKNAAMYDADLHQLTPSAGDLSLDAYYYYIKDIKAE